MTLQKRIISSDLLKWYLEKGMILDNVYMSVEFKRGLPFKKFVDKVSDIRRQGGELGDVAKLCMNSAFGKFIQDNSRYTNVQLYSEDQVEQVDRAVNNNRFINGSEITVENNTMYEVESLKKIIKHNSCITVGITLLCNAKLKMLQFYYDCLAKYLDASDFEKLYMDTDSCWISLSDPNIENIIKPEMKEEWNKDKFNWFVYNKHDNRTPGLFKEEYSAKELVCLGSKSYYAVGVDKEEKKAKISSKGCQARNKQNDVLTIEKYKECLFEEKVILGENMGFRTLIDKNGKERKYTYTTKKIALNFKYDKRGIFEDKIHTYPKE